MTLQVVFWLAMPLLVSSGNVTYHDPISAEEYSDGAGPGFSTNYFKSRNPMRRYNESNIVDVGEFGFGNLRLRVNASMHSPEDDVKFNEFLGDLETVVDDCLLHGIWPIISWVHHQAEIHPSETFRQQYIQWWVGVAQRLKDKDYRLGFNLFTELGYVGCEPEPRCVDSLRENLATYSNWTISVVSAIRGLEGKNRNRTLILTSPSKDSSGLDLIDPEIYENDNNMLVEYHFYAAGPNKREGSPRYWSGCGNKTDKQRVKDAIDPGKTWAKDHIPVYFGAWMTNDNKAGDLDQEECECFACYFAKRLGKIPWSMNVLDLYYDTKNSEWIEDLQTVPKNSDRELNMYDILRKVRKCIDNISA